MASVKAKGLARGPSSASASALRLDVEGVGAANNRSAAQSMTKTGAEGAGGSAGATSPTVGGSAVGAAGAGGEDAFEESGEKEACPMPGVDLSDYWWNTWKPRTGHLQNFVLSPEGPRLKLDIEDLVDTDTPSGLERGEADWKLSSTAEASTGLLSPSKAGGVVSSPLNRGAQNSDGDAGGPTAPVQIDKAKRCLDNKYVLIISEIPTHKKSKLQRIYLGRERA